VSAAGWLPDLPSAGTDTLERAVSYALGAVAAITPGQLPQPTPCRGWDLRMLLLHAGDSLAALAEGLGGGRVSLRPADAGPGGTADRGGTADPAQAFRAGASRLLGAYSRAGQGRFLVTVGGYPMAASVMVVAGALEIAVHGWDISRACGQCQPIPGPLASDLLQVAPLLVDCDGRYPLFAPPVRVPAAAGPSDRLAAFLGRRPGPPDPVARRDRPG
jgi:uncharacterized protein (TIGR03086 family)